MLQHLNYPISAQLSVSGRLREVKNKRKFLTFSSKMVAVAYKRFQIWWCGCRGVVVATGGSTVTPRIVSLVRQ